MYIVEVMLHALDFGGRGSSLELIENPWKQRKLKWADYAATGFSLS